MSSWRHLGALLGPSWGTIEALLGLSEGVLGPSWGSTVCETSRGLLGPHDSNGGASSGQLPHRKLKKGVLEPSWAALGALLGPSWGPLGPLLGLSWVLSGRFGSVWDASRDHIRSHG